MCPAGACEASAGPEGGGARWQSQAGGQQRPLPLRVHVPGPAVPLHALHHGGAVAETAALQTWSCCSEQQPVFTGVPLLRSAGRPAAISDAPTLITTTPQVQAGNIYTAYTAPITVFTAAVRPLNSAQQQLIWTELCIRFSIVVHLDCTAYTDTDTLLGTTH